MTVMTTPDGQLAPRNSSRVPRVVGMTLPEAARELRRGDYGCAVVAATERGGAGPALVTGQDPRPGFEGSEAQLVHLTVSGPLRKNGVPPGCVDQRDEPWAATRSG